MILMNTRFEGMFLHSIPVTGSGICVRAGTLTLYLGHPLVQEALSGLDAQFHGVSVSLSHDVRRLRRKHTSLAVRRFLDFLPGIVPSHCGSSLPVCWK